MYLTSTINQIFDEITQYSVWSIYWWWEKLFYNKADILIILESAIKQQGIKKQQIHFPGFKATIVIDIGIDDNWYRCQIWLIWHLYQIRCQSWHLILPPGTSQKEHESPKQRTIHLLPFASFVFLMNAYHTLIYHL